MHATICCRQKSWCSLVFTKIGNKNTDIMTLKVIRYLFIYKFNKYTFLSRFMENASCLKRDEI